ncbi:SdpA family antimicrobial peptide system protein [Tsukamurella paurometabola]|nr:SdpA family antimicrobial peptide system protein [Tsukamurella paurometabola]
MAIVAAPFVVICFYVAAAWLPATPFHLPGQAEYVRSGLAALSPQGWAFFTKSPMEDSFALYKVETKGIAAPVGDFPYSKPGNVFGLDREPRKQSMEMAVALKRISSDSWRRCKSKDAATCAGQASLDDKPVNMAKSETPSPTYCGRIEVVRMKTTPWAWRDLNVPARAATEATSVEVQC